MPGGDICGAANCGLFDHLVGSREQRRREVEAEHPGDLGIDYDDLGAAGVDARGDCGTRGFQTRLNALARSRHSIAKSSSTSRRLASAIAAVRIYSSA